MENSGNLGSRSPPLSILGDGSGVTSSCIESSSMAPTQAGDTASLSFGAGALSSLSDDTSSPSFNGSCPGMFMYMWSSQRSSSSCILCCAGGSFVCVTLRDAGFSCAGL